MRNSIKEMIHMITYKHWFIHTIKMLKKLAVKKVTIVHGFTHINSGSGYKVDAF